MEDQVPFKVFTFWKDGDKPEVRRFGVDRSVVTNYHYLEAKIQEVFPRLKAKAYCITWKDEDGDDIALSSDDELMTALQASSGNVIKLNVHCKDGDAKVNDVIGAPAENPIGAAGANVLHYGVMCDVCDSAVVGFRYKCATCDDFDLCSRCEAKGRHPEHCMVRVPTPRMPRSVMKIAIKRSSSLLKNVTNTVHEDLPHKKHRRDRSDERRHRGEHRGDHRGEHRGDHRGEHYGGHHGAHGGEHHNRRHRASWLDTFATYMNEFANLAGDINIDVDKPKASQTKAQEQASTSQQEAQKKQTTSTEHAQATKPEGGTSTDDTPCPFLPPISTVTFNEFKAILQMIFGEHLNEVISLLPVPAAPASASTTPAAPASASTTPAAATTQDVEMGQGDRKQTDASNVSAKMETSGSNEDERDSSPEKGEGWTMINKEKDLMDATASAPQEAAAPIGFNLPHEFQEHLKITEGGLYPPLHSATAVLNPKEKEVAEKLTAQSPQAAPATPPQAQAQAQAQATSTPNPVQQPATAPLQPQPRHPHPAPHIEAAIQHMLVMGFTNEGGWLTQLLESKDGNIAAVLDLLTPTNTKK